MRGRSVFLVCSLALGACNEPAADPSPITRIPGLAPPLAAPLDRSHDLRPPDARPSEPEPTPVAAPPPVVIAPPTAAQLSGSFDLHYNSARGDPLVEDDVRIVGDSKGATLTQMVTGKTDKVDLWRLDAKQTAALLKALDGLKWWGLDDARATGKDQSLSTLEVQRGGYTHQFRTQGPAPGAQSEAIKLVSKATASLGAKAHEKNEKPSAETFKPGKVAGAGERRQCETGPGGIEKCEGTRCFPQGKLLACFKSPFSRGVAVKANKLPGAKVPAVKATPYFWAFELKDGRKCEGPPAPESSVRWTCKGAKDVDDVERLIHSGEGLFAVISGTRQVVPIVRTWK